jgi:hypothetical protein
VQCQASTQSDAEVTAIPHHGFYRPNRGVVVLNGERYELVGKIITGGKVQGLVIRAAVDDSFDDGAINFDRLATLVRRKNASKRLSDIQKVARKVTETESPTGYVDRRRNALSNSKGTSDRKVVIAVTGSIAEKTIGHFVIDWFGGGKLTVDRSRAEGDWEQLRIGQWIEATVLRKMNGEILQAMLVGTMDEPKGYCEEELTKSYSSIPAANLESVE